MQKAWARLGLMSLIFGIFFFFSMQILFVDMLSPAMQLPALMMVVLGVVCIINAFKLKPPSTRSKRKKTAEEEFLSSLR